MTTTFVACATLIVGAHSGKKAAGGKNMEIGALVKSSGSICAEAATSSFGGSMLKMSLMHRLSRIHRHFTRILVCFSEMRFTNASPDEPIV